MSLRKFMHPRNKYKLPPKFVDLAALYPEFQQHVVVDLSGKLRLNFKNEESLRALTKVLLKRDFNLDVHIPLGKLVPALPLRLNYILWIEDLINHAGIDEVYGIDIGTGAVCIYPLLCAKMNGWKMIGTDIDPTSVMSGIENVKNNSLDHLINVTLVERKSILKDIIVDGRSYSFTICNPPFFDLDKSDKIEKSSPPRNAKTGNNTELMVEGGEHSFVHQIIDESIELKNKVVLFTSMLGLKSNLLRCQSELADKNIDNSTWTEFCQGHTKRWGLAWTFLPKSQLDLTTAPVIRTGKYNSNKKKSKNNVSELVIPLTAKCPTAMDVITKLKHLVDELQVKITELSLKNEEFDGWAYALCATKDTWSHARRKRRMAMHNEKNETKKLCIEVDEEKKYVRIENTNSCSTDTSTLNIKQPYLQTNLIITKLNIDSEQIKSTEANEQMKICMIYESGYGGKNALETLKQYLINKFDLREFIQQQKKQNSGNTKKLFE